MSTSMTRFSLFIRPNGTIEGINPDGFPLQVLGEMGVQRASTLEFDNKRQKWIVRLPDGTEKFAHPVRAKALAWERKYFEELLRKPQRGTKEE